MASGSPEPQIGLMLRVAEGLARNGFGCALVGGLAVGLRTVPRATKDIDFAVAAATDGDAEAVVRAAKGLGLRAVTLLEHAETGRIATVRFAEIGGNPEAAVDLLFAACGLETEIVDAAEPVRCGVGSVLVASLPHLVAMKVLSESPRRSQDRSDLRALLSHAPDREVRQAAAALELITARGFARGKDLRAVLLAVLADLGRLP